MTNKELFYFTGKCLMLDEDPAFRQKIIEKIKSDSIDWEKLAAFCSNHLILPAIYLKFHSHHLTEYLPEEFSGYLKEIFDLNFTRNKHILEQLEEITIILNKHDIAPVFLKGAAHLLDELYSNIGERILGDIDFLVPEKDYLPTAKILENVGYKNVSHYPIYMDIASLRHYPPIARQGRPAYLEIHQAITETNLSWFNTSIIDADKKSVPTLNGCYVLSDHHKIIHNFAHGQLHHGGHINGIVSFRDLYDLYLLSKRSDLNQTLVSVKCRHKAIAYYAFARNALGLNEHFFNKSNISFWLLSKKHELNMSSPVFYHTYRSILFLFQRIFISYSFQFFKAIYSKKVRHSVIGRLTDRNWYTAHLKTYRDFFVRKKN